MSHSVCVRIPSQVALEAARETRGALVEVPRHGTCG